MDKQKVIKKVRQKLSMDKKEYTFKIKVTRPDIAKKVLNILNVLSKLGSWGSSRSVLFFWDGDGPDNLEITEYPKEIQSINLDSQDTCKDIIDISENKCRNLSWKEIFDDFEF